MVKYLSPVKSMKNNLKKVALIVFFVTTAMTCITSATKAQLLAGQRAIEFSAGKSDVGYLINGGYIYFVTDKFSVKGGAFFEKGTPYQFSYHNIGLEALARYTAFNFSEIFLITPYAGPVLNFDNISPVKRQYAASINYGLKAGVEVEALLADQFSFFAFFNQAVLLKKSFGNERFDYGIGVRLYIGN